MLKYISALILLTLISVGCGTKEKTENKHESKEELSKTIKIDAHTAWAYFLSTKSDSIEYLYTENAIKLSTQNPPILGRKAIAEYHASHPVRITYMDSDTVVIANQKRGLEYEIGEFITEAGVKHKHLIIWQITDSIKLRDFELILKTDSTESNLTELTERRKLWMELCNDHQVEALIEELYSDSTIYYNHKPLITGHDALLREYDYMTKESYSLKLNPIIIENVNSKIIFEIGQCQGSYNGKYILVWRKDNDGKWRIYIDSNI